MVDNTKHDNTASDVTAKQSQQAPVLLLVSRPNEQLVLTAMSPHQLGHSIYSIDSPSSTYSYDRKKCLSSQDCGIGPMLAPVVQFI